MQIGGPIARLSTFPRRFPPRSPQRKSASTLRKRRQGIQAWYDHLIGTGLLEGKNNKIKLLQRQAFGDRDKEFCKLTLLRLHRSQSAFAG
ncbi:transposase [Planctellipticum variicoloris]|uniref:transposase n=1 Tax=Planctellipticum variicoloris TaxID=3064265 RepID=UPI0030132327